MSQNLSKQILFSPGRVVQGSFYKAQDKDFTTGQPRVFPQGHAKAGQPKISWFFAVAIPKSGTAAWWDTTWGRDCLTIGQQAWPQGQWQVPTFAWKIEDGDSLVPNKKGRVNARTEGFAGCWIVNFNSGFAPKIVDERGQPIIEPDVIKLGFWVEPLGTVRSNETVGNPGIYINHDIICFRGRDKEIFQGADPTTVGFGRSAVPSHVTMAPVAGATFPSQVGAQATPAAPAGVPQMPATGAYMPPGAAASIAQTAMPAAPVSVAPHPGFIAPPGAASGAAATPAANAIPQMPGAPAVGGSVPGAPPAPAAAYVDPAGAPAGHRMANPAGPRYEAYRTQGWSDAQLIGNALMVKL